jgi:Transglycosylase-like domain
MPAAPRHAKPRKPATRRGAPVVAAATLVGVAAAFVFLHGGSAAAKPAHDAMPVTSTASGFTSDYVTADVRRTVIARMINESARAAARHKHLARLAAARRARRQAAQQPAAVQPSPAPSAAPAPSSGGGDAASSPLGVCIRNSEEGGSYAWGPGNGGGAYQFLLGTWEKYGGAASEYGVAGPAYQDQIFDNAIAAGGASNWTAYDGC